MGKLEPNTASGNSPEHSDSVREYDPAAKRAQIAVIARSRPKEIFNNLMHHLTYDLVHECLAKIPNASAPGVDGMTKEVALKNLDWILPPILKTIHQGCYEAPPVRRVYIPKANGGERPLGVPAVIDRAIQAAMAKVLNAIYEQDFLVSSFGFRPKLSCHHALATINELVHGMQQNFVLGVDIRDFFGSLNHEWLSKFLGLRIGDKRVLKLIDAWLKAGVMENGELEVKESGTPQGGSISPLLSNIYLHYVLDLWFDRNIKKQLGGKANLIRYADDFSILCQFEPDVSTVKTLLIARLAQFGLVIAEDKTHITNLTPRANAGRDRRRMTFLGFSICRKRSHTGRGWSVMFKTEAKRLTRAKQSMKAKLWRIKHLDIPSQAKIINSLLVGHFNYYGIAGNVQTINRFRNLTIQYWKRCLFRRSQRELRWPEFLEILDKHPLKQPVMRVGYAKIRDFVRL
jgi:RNA-directed DNA polymerase